MRNGGFDISIISRLRSTRGETQFFLRTIHAPARDATPLCGTRRETERLLTDRRGIPPVTPARRSRDRFSFVHDRRRVARTAEVANGAQRRLQKKRARLFFLSRRAVLRSRPPDSRNGESLSRLSRLRIFHRTDRKDVRPRKSDQRERAPEKKLYRLCVRDKKKRDPISRQTSPNARPSPS